MRTYMVTVRPGNTYLNVRYAVVGISEIGCSFEARPKDVMDEARDFISLIENVPKDSFRVSIKHLDF